MLKINRKSQEIRSKECWFKKSKKNFPQGIFFLYFENVPSIQSKNDLHERCQELANLKKKEEIFFWKVFPPKYFLPFCLCSQHSAKNSSTQKSSTQKSSTTCKSQENNKIFFSKDFFPWRIFPIFCMFQATDPKRISTKRVHSLPLERKSQIEINVLLKSFISRNFFSPWFWKCSMSPIQNLPTPEFLNTCQVLEKCKILLVLFQIFEEKNFLFEWFCVSFRTTQALLSKVINSKDAKTSISGEKLPEIS